MRYCKQCETPLQGKNVNFCCMDCQAKWVSENGYVFGTTMDHREIQAKNIKMYSLAQSGSVEAMSYLRKELRMKSIFVPGQGEIRLRPEVRE